MEAYETEKAAMGENMEKEQWMKESLQMQKASWIQDEITKRREREDELLQQIFMEQKMLQELDEDMDENMAHAREGRKYREDMKARVNDRVYEIHDLSADKREGMRSFPNKRILRNNLCLPACKLLYLDKREKNFLLTDIISDIIIVRN